MRATGWLMATSSLALLAGWLIVSGWRQRRPTLVATVARLGRPAPFASSASGPSGAGGMRRGWERAIGAHPLVRSAGERWAPTLRLIGRSSEQHVTILTAAALAGLVAPTLGAAVATVVTGTAVPLAIPALLSIAAAIGAPAVVHGAAVARADDARIDVRYQLSAYLDMVIMLLAGNSGHEGSLQHAAQTGDGLLFQQLRRRIREVGATGSSLVEALSQVARDFDLVELEQVAATTALSAAQGAPVARTLAAKCSTLRATIAAEQEAAARVRTDKVTPPLVGMALLFMALIIYPALNLN